MTEAQPLEEQGGLQVRKPAEKHVFKAPNPVKSLLGEYKQCMQNVDRTVSKLTDSERLSHCGYRGGEPQWATLAVHVLQGWTCWLDRSAWNRAKRSLPLVSRHRATQKLSG